MLKIIISLLLTVFISSCVSSSWTYDNKKYNTSNEAIEAARQDVRAKVSTVTPIERPVANSVLIYTPSINWAKHGVLVTGAASDEQIRYISTVLYYGYHAMAEGVKKRGIFKNADVMEFNQRDPLNATKYEYLLWLRLDNPDSAQWMISPAGDTSAPTPIYTSPISDGGDRVNAFVTSVEKYIESKK